MMADVAHRPAIPLSTRPIAANTAGTARVNSAIALLNSVTTSGIMSGTNGSAMRPQRLASGGANTCRPRVATLFQPVRKDGLKGWQAVIGFGGDGFEPAE